MIGIDAVSLLAEIEGTTTLAAAEAELRGHGLTLDIGHLQCMGELPIAPHIRKWKDRLWNVHIEDMKRGFHEHLMFGEGEIDFKEVFAALKQIDYKGGVFVELSRHSHMAVETARKSLAFLRAASEG